MSEHQSTVEYREIKDFPGYRVGNDGSAWSCWQLQMLGRPRGCRPIMNPSVWRQLKGNRIKGGYLIVALRAKGRVRYRQLHRLVLEAFVGPCPVGMQACHDPDPTPANCRLSNLRWATAKQNMADRDRHGRTQRGERHQDAKLKEKDVLAIISSYLALKQAGRSTYGFGRSTAKKYGVTVSLISRIVRRKTWKHLSDPAGALSRGSS